jgi:hypothetical protein
MGTRLLIASSVVFVTITLVRPEDLRVDKSSEVAVRGSRFKTIAGFLGLNRSKLTRRRERLEKRGPRSHHFLHGQTWIQICSNSPAQGSNLCTPATAARWILLDLESHRGLRGAQTHVACWIFVGFRVAMTCVRIALMPENRP